MSTKIYPKDLREFIDEYHYIPKKVKFVDEIKQFAKYFCLQQKIGFKIEEIIEVSGQIYYQIRFLDNNRQAVIPYESKFTYYELLVDKMDIKRIDNIINTGVPYYGSEIKYWFYTHKINLYSNCYKGFLSLLTDSKRIISDRKVYLLKAIYLSTDDTYIKCRAEVYRH